MNFIFYNTEDMLNYCNIEVTYNDGTGAKTVMLTKDNVDEGFSWKQTVVAKHLPATFTFSRKVTLKQSVDEVETFTYTRGYFYAYAFYNAAGKHVKDGTPFNYINEIPVSGAAVATIINSGRLDKTYTYTFDEKGEMFSQQGGQID